MLRKQRVIGNKYAHGSEALPFVKEILLLPIACGEECVAAEYAYSYGGRIRAPFRDPCAASSFLAFDVAWDPITVPTGSIPMPRPLTPATFHPSAREMGR